jgi:hypothetical protein
VRYAAQAAACPLSRWRGDESRCRWCDAPVREAGSMWCSTHCEDDYRRNHWWDLARLTALARDGERCVWCGRGPATITEGKLVLRALVPFGSVDTPRLWQSEAWQRFEVDCTVEVQHIQPRHGMGYGAGCHHHLDGLMTLCHRHHVEITAHAAAPRSASRSVDAVPIASASWQ